MSLKNILKSIPESQRNDFLDLLIKAVGHKYIKRTGTTGNYRYWYKDTKTGKITEGKEPTGKEREERGKELDSNIKEKTNSLGTKSYTVYLKDGTEVISTGKKGIAYNIVDAFENNNIKNKQDLLNMDKPFHNNLLNAGDYKLFNEAHASTGVTEKLSNLDHKQVTDIYTDAQTKDKSKFKGVGSIAELRAKGYLKLDENSGKYNFTKKGEEELNKKQDGEKKEQYDEAYRGALEEGLNEEEAKEYAENQVFTTKKEPKSSDSFGLGIPELRWGIPKEIYKEVIDVVRSSSSKEEKKKKVEGLLKKLKEDKEIANKGDIEKLKKQYRSLQDDIDHYSQQREQFSDNKEPYNKKIKELESEQEKILSDLKEKETKKALTIGSSGTQAPANRTGAGALVTEDLDHTIQDVSWGKEKKKKKKKAIKKAIELIRKNNPDMPLNEVLSIAAKATAEFFDKAEGKAPKITDKEAKAIGEKIGIKWEDVRFTPKDLIAGINVEIEHSDLVGNDKEKLAKIAWVHLKELPDYYKRLKVMEEVGKKDLNKEQYEKEIL